MNEQFIRIINLDYENKDGNILRSNILNKTAAKIMNHFNV